jgi:hypothetical protein
LQNALRHSSCWRKQRLRRLGKSRAMSWSSFAMGIVIILARSRRNSRAQKAGAPHLAERGCGIRAGMRAASSRRLAPASSRMLRPLGAGAALRAWKCTRGGTRTRNLPLRREAPYPLGRTSSHQRGHVQASKQSRNTRRYSAAGPEPAQSLIVRRPTWQTHSAPYVDYGSRRDETRLPPRAHRRNLRDARA